MMAYFHGGESGIRTHGTLPHAGFQDRYLQPLGHLSKTLSTIPQVKLFCHGVDKRGLPL